MGLKSQLGVMRRAILCRYYRRNVPLGDAGPVVSFSFDDFPRTSYVVAGEILERYGVRGTYYVTAGLMGRVDHLGEQFNKEDLRELAAKGHELGSQTFSHLSGRSTALATFETDVQRGMREIESMTGIEPTNFAYPYGHVTLRLKRTIGPTMTSSRSVIPGFNGPVVDLNLLKAHRLYGGTEQVSCLREAIAENVRRKTWLIFYTHDVRSDHSPFGCTAQLFEAVVEAVVKSGSRILPVGAVIRELVPQHTHESAPVLHAHSV